MTSFEAGFFEHARYCGVPFEKASHILKSAMEHPETQHMFKELPEDEQKEHQDISFLADILNQDAVDKKMQQASMSLKQQ